MTPDLRLLHDEVSALALEISEYLRAEAPRVEVGAIELKALNSLVSYVDRTAEERILKRLGELLPQSTFLAEEGTAVYDPAAEWCWVVDPLDGTTNFLHGLPCYAVSIGLRRNGIECLGVVADAPRSDIYSAYGESPLFRNGAERQPLQPVSLADALIATGFPYHDYRDVEGTHAILDDLMRNTRGVRRWGAAAIDLAYVADGRFQGFYEYGLQPWDLSAGGFLVKRAGGSVSDFWGGEEWRSGASILAGVPGVYDELLGKTKGYYRPSVHSEQ